MKTVKLSAFITALIIAVISCRPIEQISDVPNIEYVSFTIFDTVDILGNDNKGGTLKFRFEDGDGNVGLYNQSEDQADTNNLILQLYRKTDGVMVPALPGDPLTPSSYRIPYMEREGQNKILTGTISVTFLFLFYTQQDTIMYDFYIMDRALNQSNIVSTNEIIVSENNTY